MNWLTGGWQRVRATMPGRSPADRPTARATKPAGDTRVYSVPPRPQQPQASGATLLGAQAQDVDVSASSFRNLLVGGGISGFFTILSAASLEYRGSSVQAWFWQLLFGVIFLWFLSASRGMMSSRGFLFDRSGFYVRTRGEVFGVAWGEISAIGIGTVPWIQHRRPVHPGQRQALELYPADPGFPGRHPEFERWLINEPAPMSGLPTVRYRFHLPPFTRLPRHLEDAVQAVASRKWVGQYKRELPAPQA
jgi:hypothetical protein